MIKTLITAIFLSQAFIGGVHANRENYIRLADNNPFYGARSIGVVLKRDKFTTPKAPVRYYQFWDCRWKQTAQQCVAIEYLLQQELKK